MAGVMNAVLSFFFGGGAVAGNTRRGARFSSSLYCNL